MSELEPGDTAETETSLTPEGFDLAVARAELVNLRAKYDGCLAINREQVVRLSRVEIELETLRSKDPIQRAVIDKLQKRIVELESPKPTPAATP